ncbi:MAG: calcium/sodium antiporter [Flavobacteriales bacterium]|nr:calcium/sodium antiporter [Flavobacteriales bacterium]
MLDWLLLVAGLVLLIFSGEALVKGAVGVAIKYKVSTLVIGMTIVSAGTSAPELFVSLKAALEGHPEISVGNVVGSNIANISIILGLTALIFPIRIQLATLRLDWPAMFIASILLYLFSLNEIIGFWEGVVFVLFVISFSVYIIVQSKKNNATESNQEADEIIESAKGTAFLKAVFFIIIGCVGLVFGSEFLLKGAVGIAKGYGISERIIGLTLVAFGTSVPELITSCVAAFRKQSDIAIGNLIGSNLFNILFILGTTAVIKDIPISKSSFFTDIYFMLGVSFLIFPLMFFGLKLNRIKGAILFLYYITYVFLLF